MLMKDSTLSYPRTIVPYPTTATFAFAILTSYVSLQLTAYERAYMIADHVPINQMDDLSLNRRVHQARGLVDDNEHWIQCQSASQPCR
jgi:hypothetical protein